MSLENRPSAWSRLRKIFAPGDRSSNSDAPEFAGERAGALKVAEPSASADFPIVHFSTVTEWESYREAEAPELARRAAIETGLTSGGQKYFEVPGHCFVCGGPSSFSVSYDYAYEVDGVLTPNWREHLRCLRCGLSNRMRAALHLLETLLQPPTSSRIYITEQLSPIYDRLSKRYAEVIGSEYLRDGTPRGGVNGNGVRHEDLTQLSFESGRFDLLISFDVLEHVPAYRAGLAECARSLRPGGKLLLSVPFLIDSADHLVRAKLRDDETVEHLLPPEYHGDPLIEEGCLAFYQFGWELLDELRGLGFEDAAGHLYWSRHYAYLGRHQLIFTARKKEA